MTALKVAPRSPFSEFIIEVERLLHRSNLDRCRQIGESLRPLLSEKGWIAPELLHQRRDGYRRELLYEDDAGVFSIGCFVWGAGQGTPIHDHRSWSVIGVLSGALQSENFAMSASGRLETSAPAELLCEGEVVWLDPTIGDIHRIGAGSGDGGVSVHIYGCRFTDVCRARYDYVA
jgi:predicted metal-dependent enzyme (double-stranded beta helix superfamily)